MIKKTFMGVCLAAVTMLFSGCWTSILTVAPTTDYVAPAKTVYTTHVTTPAPKYTTIQTVTVTAYNADMSFYLDLNAVAAAFAESNSTREFEQLLNSSRYMINNLDLNRDGYIDYLRVIETRKSAYHALLIQACLAPSVFQDIATLVAERRASTLYVELIGDRYLYGYNYIVRPTFVKRPPMWEVFGKPAYNPWVSPYYYGYWPSYYKQPKPVYLNHYQAYVRTYMNNHHYCHVCDYPTVFFYADYNYVTKPHRRNDYEQQHPNNSFEHRMTANGSGVTVRNAGQLRTQTMANRTNSSSATTTTQSGVTNRNNSSTTATSTTRKPATTTTTNSKPTVQTTVNTRVNKSGVTRTTVKRMDEKGKTQTIQRTSTSSRTQAKPTTTTTSTTRKPATTTTTSTTRKPATTTTTTSTSSRR